jgi:cytoskeletal protein CcmA (bactofilin family)
VASVRARKFSISGDISASISGGVSGGSIALNEHIAAPAASFSIPQQVTIEGAIDYAGAMVIAGTIDGDVTCVSLIVTERGVINGSVRSQTVTVLGEINGEIVANTLTLKTACSVTGDIFHKQLVLEDGAYFEGRSRRLAKPLELVE